VKGLYRDQYKMEKLDGLMVNKASVDALMAGEDPRRVAGDWREGIERFVERRGKYLLY
jgi:hypothetical protein